MHITPSHKVGALLQTVQCTFSKQEGKDRPTQRKKDTEENAHPKKPAKVFSLTSNH